MSKKRLLASAALLAALAVTLNLILQKAEPGLPDLSGHTVHPPSPPTIGEEILGDYADTNKPPANDLELADRLLFSYRTLVKNHADKPVGTNADFVDALLGDNPAKHVFLPEDFPHLSPGGELLDRWRTPLFIHPEAADRITLRSAGPDKKMWTGDDIVRGPR